MSQTRPGKNHQRSEPFEFSLGKTDQRRRINSHAVGSRIGITSIEFIVVSGVATISAFELFEWLIVNLVL